MKFAPWIKRLGFWGFMFFLVKGLLWLAIIGLVLFVATGVWGWLKRRTNA